MSQLGNSRTPNLAELFSTIIENRLADVHVALPGVVTKFDKTRQTVTVKPLLKNTVVFDDGEEESESLPEFPDVPVLYPRGGGYFLAFPLEKGDNVLLVFNERSIDNYWFSTGRQEVDPVDLRKHDLSDAVAIPGFQPLSRVLKEDLSSGVFGKEKAAQIRAKGSTVEVVSNGAPSALDFVAMSTKVDAQLTEIRTLLTTWTVAPNDGGAALKTAAAALWLTPPSSVASSNLKAD